MHKVLAEIIAGMIPQKMARNRWRGILRYGLTKAISLKYRLKHTNHSPDIYLAICAIAKDEGQYMQEWIEWHLKMGVDKFFIYDNESSDNTKEVLQPYIDCGIVEYIYYPGYRKQIAAYDDCMERHRWDTRWIAFIDLDEFIVPKLDATFRDFIKRFEAYPDVEINWLIYGSGGEDKKRIGGVMERFRSHSLGNHKLNRHVKSVVNPRRVFNMIGCHEAACIDGKAVDTHGNEINHNFREREPLQDVICINHYAVKSLEEFKEKCSKGRASGKKRWIDMEYFNQYDLNDITEK